MSEPTPASAPAPPSPEKPRLRAAWQPFTPRGIGAFAAAPFGRLFIAQVVVALLAAGAVVWFLLAVWFPVARESIRNFAGDGSIRARQLEVSGVGVERLVTNRFLTFAIDTQTENPQSYSVDVFVVLRRAHYEVCSILGCARFQYPVQNAPFNRLELEAQWGAWEPFLLGIAAVGAALGLLFSWWILASLYFLFVRTFAFFADREVTLGGSWRLCGAALLPAALLLTAAIVGYGFSVLDLFQLFLIAVLHVILPWALIAFAVRALPRVTLRGTVNPFSGATTPQAAPERPSPDPPKT